MVTLGLAVAALHTVICKIIFQTIHQRIMQENDIGFLWQNAIDQ